MPNRDNDTLSGKMVSSRLVPDPQFKSSGVQKLLFQNNPVSVLKNKFLINIEKKKKRFYWFNS